MKPSVGRIVHYTSSDDLNVSAAIITKVTPKDFVGGRDAYVEEREHHVALHVFQYRSALWLDDVPFANAGAGTEEARGKWSWPAKYSEKVTP